MPTTPIACAVTPQFVTSPGLLGAGGSSGRRTLAAVFICFLAAGVATVMLGPTLPLLAARWNLSDSRLGTLFFAFFIGQFCGAWLATPRVWLSLLLGCVGSALGLVMLAFAGPITAYLALFCVGIGLGAGLTAGNVIVGTSSFFDGGKAPGGQEWQRSRRLALLNVSWGIGAIACPLLLGASLRVRRVPAQSGQVFFLGLAMAFAGCAAVVAWLRPRRPPLPVETQRKARLPLSVFCIFGATLVLYVGVENCLGGWLPTYAERLSQDAPAGRASAIALCFWVCEVAGRGLTALMIPRLNQTGIYRGCLLLLVAAAGALAVTPRLGVTAVFAMTAIVALSVAPLYPLAVSFLLARTGNSARLGKLFAAASLGGTVLPWLTGLLSSHFQNLRIGLAVPVAGAALLLLFSFFLPRPAGVRV